MRTPLERMWWRELRCRILGHAPALDGDHPYCSHCGETLLRPGQRRPF